MRDGGREEMEGENRRGPKLLIDFEEEEKMEENKDMNEASEVGRWGGGGGGRVTGAGQESKRRPGDGNAHWPLY